MSEKLQSVQIYLTIAVSLYKLLIKYIENLWNSFIEKSSVNKYKFKRTKNIKMPYDESNQNNKKNTFQDRDLFKINIYIVIMDSLLVELKKKKKCLYYD